MSDPRKVAEVRAELVRLGYLRDRVDRWFLADLADRGPLRSALGGAARAAILLALPLAIGLALLVLARNPVSGPATDVVILALHLAPLTLLVSFSGLFLAGAGGTWWVSRGHVFDPDFVARLVSVTSTFGLTIAAVASTVARPPLGVFLSALLLAGLAFVIERVIYDEMLALFVAVEGIAPQTRRTGNAVLAAMVVGLVAVSTLASTLLSGAREAEIDRTGLIVEPRAGRTVVMAVDGLEERTLRHLASEGLVPTLARVDAEGSRHTYARTAAPPPEIWTTIWTGVPPDVHGMRSYEWLRPAGLNRVLVDSWPASPWLRHVSVRLGLAQAGAATATERQAAALWEITSRAGYPTLQVGCWGSGPARSLLGRSITHRAPFALVAGADASGELAPPELADRLSKIQVVVDPHGEWLDELHSKIFQELWGERQERVGIIYLPALDLIRNPTEGAGLETDLLDRADATRRAYVRLDRLVRSIVGDFAQQDRLMLVGDSGRDGDEDSAGLVILFGAWSSSAAKAVNVEDLLPSLLVELGIPLSSELVGRPRLTTATPLAPVSGYPRPDRAPPLASEEASEYLEQLRSLGYLQ